MLASLSLPVSASYYYHNETIEDSSGKIEISIQIDRDFFIPALERSLSEDSSVKVHSIEIQDLFNEGPLFTGIGSTFPLNIKVSMQGKDYNVVCSVHLFGSGNMVTGSNLIVERCREEQGLLTFTVSPLLAISNVTEAFILAIGTKLYDYDQPIVEIKQTTTKYRLCQSKVFITEQGCPEEVNRHATKIMKVGVYKRK